MARKSVGRGVEEVGKIITGNTPSTIKKKIEKVLFKEIIRACSFIHVKEALLRLYPDQKKNINGYRDVFETLHNMRSRGNREGMAIVIRRVGRGKNAYFSVSGICLENDIQQSYALEYTPWPEWLGYEVAQSVLKKLSKEEIAAHCLWEMTFAGFTQGKIRRRVNALKKQIKDVEEGRVKTIPHNEVMALLKEKSKSKGK
ncbi:MAG: hypothetical protein HZA15_16850 [Nitrospirae bacterium]|nr:hypothetical protein [Nitrospirota bacterium]